MESKKMPKIGNRLHSATDLSSQDFTLVAIYRQKVVTASVFSKLETHIAEFVNYYNNQRYHVSLNNVTPADLYFGGAQEILARREIIKQRTLLKIKLDLEVQKTTLI